MIFVLLKIGRGIIKPKLRKMKNISFFIV